MKKVFCVIPAWNEEKNISRVLSQVVDLVDVVVVVDDGSEDNTYSESKKHKAVVLRHILNRGQGAALETGNKYCLKNGADIIVHFDADGQFLAREIKEVVEPLKRQEADIVFGSRFLEKRSRIPWQKEKIIFPLARLVNKHLLGVRLSDPQSGFRAFTAQAAPRINIEQDGMAHCSEIIYKAFRSDLNIKEIPISVIYNDYGQKFSGGIKIIKDLLMAKITD